MIPTLKKPNTILFILLLAPFVRPLGLDYYPIIGKFLTLWKLLAIVYLIPALLPKLVQPHPKKSFYPFIGLALFWTIYLLGCLRVGLEVVSIATAGLSSMLLLLLISYETRIGNGMILLNPVSKQIWDCLSQETDLAAVVKAVTDRFAVSPQEAQGDILEFIDKLRQLQLLDE